MIMKFVKTAHCIVHNMCFIATYLKLCTYFLSSFLDFRTFKIIPHNIVFLKIILFYFSKYKKEKKILSKKIIAFFCNFDGFSSFSVQIVYVPYIC